MRRDRTKRTGRGEVAELRGAIRHGWPCGAVLARHSRSRWPHDSCFTPSRAYGAQRRPHQLSAPRLTISPTSLTGLLCTYLRGHLVLCWPPSLEPCAPQAQNSLSAYRALGPDFHSQLRAYRDVQRQLNNAQYTLSQYHSMEQELRQQQEHYQQHGHDGGMDVW